MAKRCESRHFRLLPPNAGFVMANTRLLSEDQQGHGQKRQNDWLPAGESHVLYLQQIIDILIRSVEIRPGVAEGLDGEIGHGMFRHFPRKIRAERHRVGTRQ